MTELAGLGTTHALYAPNRLGSIGVSAARVEVRVADLDDAGAHLPRGEPGELMVRGPIVMLGYYGNPGGHGRDHRARRLAAHRRRRAMDADGYVFVVDRRKDMIITGGYNVYPAEIERVLAAHPAVAMVAVGPVPDESRASSPGPMSCSPGATATEEESSTTAGASWRPTSCPRVGAFVDDLPKTSTGKVMRRELRKLDDDFDTASS